MFLADELSEGGFRSSSMSSSIDWWLVTNILGQLTGSTCLTPEYATDRLSWNIRNYLPIHTA